MKRRSAKNTDSESAFVLEDESVPLEVYAQSLRERAQEVHFEHDAIDRKMYHERHESHRELVKDRTRNTAKNIGCNIADDLHSRGYTQLAADIKYICDGERLSDLDGRQVADAFEQMAQVIENASTK